MALGGACLADGVDFVERVDEVDGVDRAFPCAVFKNVFPLGARASSPAPWCADTLVRLLGRVRTPAIPGRKPVVRSPRFSGAKSVLDALVAGMLGH